ncbi:OLC1v1027067C1 [Oldenlandia corymbosa var. corymbosa]|uniref:OLC1v1027067C1 n=1 Tax=Oldenlandia corymbosa var. corymbosa TaxID=529605 RepID=A0AAV1CBA7_OLDCO|nr:OLC1v1027067C1 [Oldenlandia corymbosa var. corymbosa]
MEPNNNGEAAKSSRKRKMKDVVVTEATPTPTSVVQSRLPVRYFPMHQPPNTPSLSLNIHHPSAVDYNQNTSSTFRFDLNTRPSPTRVPNSFPNESHDPYSIKPASSFTELLTAGDDDLMPRYVMEQNAHIDQLIAAQGDQLRRSLAEAQRRQYCLLLFDAEERAAKKLKEKDLELSEMASQKAALEHKEVALHREISELQRRVKALERENGALRLDVQEALILGGKLESSGYSDENDDVQSANNVDPAGSRVEPVRLVCKVCTRQVANMMMWPCRHLCLCKGCAGPVRACPVCRRRSINTVEINLKDE